MARRSFEMADESNNQLSMGITADSEGIGTEERRMIDELFSATYEELKRLAAFFRYNDGKATLSPTTLVDEAWLKLAKTRLKFESHLHFKRIAARAMREILVEAARRRNSQKRKGDGEAIFVTFSDFAQPVSCDRQFLALHESLDELARLNPRQALMVESRYFGGLNVAETATLLKVSEATILRDWRAAKAWLAAEIRRRC
jgi:RNA polymerase sigma factor (TIGR02999 family)